MGSLLGLLAFMVVAVGLIGWLWIIVLAFQAGETLWGIGCFFIFPLCLIYGFLNLDEAKIPLIMVTVSIVGRIAIGVMGAAMMG